MSSKPSTQPPPPPPAPPRPPTSKPPARQPKASTEAFSVSQGVTVEAQKIVIYGPGGVGKTELCANLADVGLKPLFIDVENGSRFLDVTRIDPSPTTLEDLRAVLQNRELLEPFDVVVVDSLTKVEELNVAWVIANIQHEKKKPISAIEDYGWGKGYTHLYDTMLLVLGDLDGVARFGKHVVCVTHECTAPVPNPGGEDWIQYQPRLQSTKQGMIRERVKEWCDHLLRVEFDVFVEGGKAQGSGSRTIYPTQMPTHWAKSRTLSESIPYKQGDAALWEQLFKGGN